MIAGILGLAAWAPAPARAEGSAELGVEQTLRWTTDLSVDILDGATERIVFVGAGTIAVTAPDGTAWGTFGSGEEIALSAGLEGSWSIALSEDQVGSWDIAVTGAAGGRLHSPQWRLQAPDFGTALDASLYGYVPTSPTADVVVEMRFVGLAGATYEVMANATGVDGENAGRSVPVAGNDASPAYALYLDVPERAVYGTAAPAISAAAFDGGPAGCNAVAPGASAGRFAFDASAPGVAHVVCDLDGDGVYDPSGADFVRVAEVEAGPAEIPFDGSDGGASLPVGAYDCVASLALGEIHFVAEDIETLYPGARFFEVDATGARRPLAMVWDDSRIASSSVPMPDGAIGLASSGPAGLHAGDPDDDPEANVNARAWGDFSGAGRGNDAFLDTWTRPYEATSAPFVLDVIDPSRDADADGLPDWVERCELGTAPDDGDTDSDGLLDGEEVDAYDTDPALADTDSDGLFDGDEIALGTDPTRGDTDSDGLLDGEEVDPLSTDPLRADTDSDGLLDGEEVDAYDTDPTLADTDSDGLSDGTEVEAHGTDPALADTDGGGTDDGEEVALGADPLDRGDDDPDADGLDNAAEAAAGSDERRADTDSDGLSDGEEVGTYGTNPTLADTDSDGLSDGDEIGEHGTDPLDPDSDSDALPDGTEIAVGSDPHHPDSDGDGRFDGQDGIGDSDGDGVPNVLDPVEDGKGTFTGSGFGCRTAPLPAGWFAVIAAIGWAAARPLRRRARRC